MAPLVAKIVWPINVPPGAWLRAIWGIRGWKVAAKIEAPACYDKFLRLILGYRQHLAHILNTAGVIVRGDLGPTLPSVCLKTGWSSTDKILMRLSSEVMAEHSRRSILRFSLRFPPRATYGPI